MNIDKSIIDSTVKSVLRGYRLDYRHGTLSDFGDASSRAEAQLMSGIWTKALISCEGFCFRESAVRAEAAVAACIHAGLEKRCIRYSNNRYLLQLPNFNYLIYREVSGFTALPVSVSSAMYGNREAIGLDKETFAEFLFSFDALVPDIRSAADGIRQAIHDDLLEKEKEAMVSRILATAESARSLRP